MADFTELTPDPSTSFTPPGDIGWRDYFLRQQAFLQSVTKQVNPWNVGSVPYVTANGYLSTNATLTVTALAALVAAGPSTGTVTSVSVTTSNGVSGTVATPTTTPAISLTLGAITPTSVTSDAYLLSSSASIVDTTTARTLSASDNGKWIHFTNAGAITLSMAGSLGEFNCAVLQEGAGKITFGANSQTMTVAGGFTKTAYAGAAALIISRASGTFWISGTLA